MWDIPSCLTVSKLLDESEAHKRASQYSTRKGVVRGRTRGYPLLRKEEAVKLRAVHRGTWWAFAHTVVTSQFVLGKWDYPQGQDTQP